MADRAIPTWFAPMCSTKAGITRTKRTHGFHLFRHSAGSTLQERAANLKTTSSFLRHAGTQITGDIYTHLVPDVERAAVEELEAAMGFPPNLFSTVPKMIKGSQSAEPETLVLQ